MFLVSSVFPRFKGYFRCWWDIYVLGFEQLASSFQVLGFEFLVSWLFFRSEQVVSLFLLLVVAWLNLGRWQSSFQFLGLALFRSWLLLGFEQFAP